LKKKRADGDLELQPTEGKKPVNEEKRGLLTTMEEGVRPEGTKKPFRRIGNKKNPR